MKCDDIIDDIILHEVLGINTTGTSISVYDEGILVVSGVDKFDFKGTGIIATSLGGGDINISVPDIQVDSGALWVYDVTRTKWLSTFRSTFGAGEKGRTKNKYLPAYDGQVTNLSGYRLARKATITAISAQTRNIETWTLRVRKNGDPSNIASLTMNAVNGNHFASINVDLDEGDQVQFFAETTSFFGIKDPLIWIEVAWRNDVLPAP